MHLSFQIVNPMKPQNEEPHSGKAIQIMLDDEGLDRLVEVLTSFRENGGHIHLRSDNMINDKTPFGSDAVSEVIITHGGD